MTHVVSASSLMFHWIVHLIRSHSNESTTCAGLLLTFAPLLFAVTISRLQDAGLLGPNGLPDLFLIEQWSFLPSSVCYVIGIAMTIFGLWSQSQDIRR